MRNCLRNLAFVEYGKSPNEVRDLNGIYPIYGTGGLVGTSNRFLFDQDAIVVARKGTLDNPTYVEGKYWIIDTAYATIPRDNVDAKWLYYCLSDFDLRKLNEATGVPSISRDYLYRIEFYTPDLPKQQKIAKILTTVDNLIEQTQALIDKYTAIKQGMMADLFTRGIDLSGTPETNPNHGQLRPSFEEAPELYKETELGWVPRGWEVESLGEIAEFWSGYAFKNQELSEHGMKAVRISNLHKPDFPYWHYDGPIKNTWVVECGDLLFSWAGVASSIDAYIYHGERALLNQHIYNFRIESETLKIHTYNYLQFVLPKLREEIEGGAGQLHLTKGKIQSISIPKPQLVELEKIVLTSKSIGQKIEKEIDYQKVLAEMKKGLMQDLLTGKVQVTA